MTTRNQKPTDLSFDHGIRQDVESSTPIGLQQATNLEMDRFRRLQRRGGFATVATPKLAKTNSYAGPVKRFADGPNGERLMFTDTTAYAYYPGRSGVAEAGFDQSYLTQRATLIGRSNIGVDQANTVYFSDCAVVTSGSYRYLVVAYTAYSYSSSTYAVHADVIDIATGAHLHTGVLIGGTNTNVQPRVVAIGTLAFVIYGSSTNNRISYGKFDLTGPTFAAPTTGNLITDADGSSQFFDAAASYNSRIAIAYRYNNGSGGISAKVALYDTSGAIVGSAYSWANSSSAAWSSGAFGIRGASDASDRIVACGNDSANNNMEFVSLAYDLSDPQTTFQAVGSDTMRQITVGKPGTGYSVVAWSPYSSLVSAADTAQPRGHLYWAIVRENGVGLQPSIFYTDSGSSGRTIFANYSIGSKFFTDPVSGIVYSLARFNDPSGFQSHFLLLDWNTGAKIRTPQPIAHVASGVVPLKGENVNPGVGGLAGTDAYGGFVFASPVNVGASELSGGQVGVWTWRASSHLNYLNTNAQGATIVGGGTPLAFDGQRLVEESFYSYPCVGGTASPSSTVIYAFVYEWVDATGNRHQSPPCPQLSQVGSPFTISTLHATRKQSYPLVVTGGESTEIRSPIRIVAYRSAPGDELLRRHRVVAVVDTLKETPISWTDDGSSTAANEILYTQRGELFTTAPPPTLQPIAHAGRVWGCDAEFPERIWCTKVLESGEAPSYNPALQVTIPGAGKIQGIAAQDGKVYALSTGGVWLASYGDGPDNTGGGSFPAPQLINGGISCHDPRSIVIGDDGIYFAAEAKWGTTIYQIARGAGSPVDIGSRVRDLLQSYPVVRGALDNHKKDRAEFLCVDNDDAPTRSVILYYHYSQKDEEGIGQWTCASFKGTNAPLEALGSWNSVSVVADTAGGVGLQDDATYTDLGTGFSATLETGDLRPFGLLSAGRVDTVSLMTTKRADGTLSVEASFDSGVTYGESASWSTADDVAGVTTAHHWESPTKDLKYGSIRYRMSDSASDGTAGSVWHGIVVETNAIGGSVRLPAGMRK